MTSWRLLALLFGAFLSLLPAHPVAIATASATRHSTPGVWSRSPTTSAALSAAARQVATTTSTGPLTSRLSSPLAAPTTTSPDAAPPSSLATEPAWVRSVFSCISWRESRDEPTVVNPTSGDGGLYQFNVTTWLANGGGRFASAAQYATPAEQGDVAYWTWEAAGFTPWTGDNVCWE